MSTSSAKSCSFVDRLAAGEAVDGLVLLRVVEHLRRCRARGVVDAALPVGHRDDLGADLRQQVGRDRADVAEALDRDGRALDVEAEVLRRFARHDHHAASGRLAPSERAAHLDRLAGDDRRLGVADVHAVGVHDPRHHLLVGVHVRRRHVLLGADGVDDLGDVAAGQRFELAPRHPRRIADDARPCRRRTGRAQRRTSRSSTPPAP